MDKFNFNPSIHGARGAFSFAVFFFHVVNSGLPTLGGVRGSWLERYLLFSGMFGVELFFGISGVVIVGALRNSTSIREFLWNRASRIYPVLWTTIFFISIISLVSGDPKHLLKAWLPWMCNFFAPPPFFSINLVNPAAWSLGYEITFYLLCAGGWYLRSRGVRWWLAATIFIGGIMVILYPRSILMPIGVLIACGLMNHPWMDRLSKSPFTCLMIFLIGWRGIFEVYDVDGNGLPSPIHTELIVYLQAFTFILLFSIFGGLALNGIFKGYGVTGKVLRSRVMMRLGTISYSFYLWQPLVFAITKAGIYFLHIDRYFGVVSQIFLLCASLPVLIVISVYSESILEKRLTRLLRRIGPAGSDAHTPTTTLIT